MLEFFIWVAFSFGFVLPLLVYLIERDVDQEFTFFNFRPKFGDLEQEQTKTIKGSTMIEKSVHPSAIIGVDDGYTDEAREFLSKYSVVYSEELEYEDEIERLNQKYGNDDQF